MFSKLPDKMLLELSGKFLLRTCEKGDEIFKQGDPNKGIYPNKSDTFKTNLGYRASVHQLLAFHPKYL